MMRLIALVSIAVLSDAIKRARFPWPFGYRIGRAEAAGVSAVEAREAILGDDV